MAPPPPKYSLFELLYGLVDPWLFLLRMTTYLPGTIYGLVQRRESLTLRSWQRFRNAWFTNFWVVFAPTMRADFGDKIAALLAGRVKNGEITEEPHHPPVSGRAIEIGPGTGNWSSLIVEAGATKVFGIEPNLKSAQLLMDNIENQGIADKYSVLPVGIEDLHTQGHVEPESLDCIITILTLCSVPEPQRLIPEVYKYLKKGGRWYVFEHVGTKAGRFMRFQQSFLNIFWPTFFGGCEVNRPTESWLRSAGEFESIDLAQPPAELWFQGLPHTLGILTK